MDKSRLTFLFQVYFNKTATPAEHDELMSLLEQTENDELVKDLLTNTWEQYTSQSQPFNDRQGEEMLTAILQEGRSHKPVAFMARRQASGWRRMAAAAAVLLVFFTGGYFWLTNQRPGRQTTPSTKNLQFIHDTIVPGGNKAVLTLADGSSIILDSTQQGTVTKQGNAKVINLETAVLTYKAGNGNGQEVVYNTLSTPRGGQYQLVLPDGSKVWLNASSSIRYPVTFKGKERNVSITGEAYFEVAKNATMPFTVTVKEATVQVLGTHFNIMAYDDEGSMNTTLLEGSVKVSKGAQHKILAPGQQAKIAQTGAIKIKEADIEEVMAWKNGWFQFNSWNIEKIMRQVARWYDVEIVYEGSISARHFSGMVSRENNISQVLKIMQAGGVHFKISGRKIIVSDDHQ
jgi:transmembrane sensor